MLRRSLPDLTGSYASLRAVSPPWRFCGFVAVPVAANFLPDWPGGVGGVRVLVMGVGGWDVFVSYGHGDADWVRVLAGNLHRAGFEVFLDEWELVGGDRVTGRLEDAIRESANGVLVVSPHALSRPWVREEYEALLRQAVEDPAGGG